MTLTWSHPDAFAAPLPTLNPAAFPGHFLDWVVTQRVVYADLLLVSPRLVGNHRHDGHPVPEPITAACLLLAAIARRVR